MTLSSPRRPRHQLVGSVEPVRTIVNQLEGWVLRGLLFMGDPHLASYTPGRRLDPSYLDTVLGKLRQCAQVSKDRGLLPVCPGDLVDEHDDTDPVMHYRTTETLQEFEPPMVTTVGNHDIGKKDIQLTEKAFMALLGLTGTIDLVQRPGFWGRLALTSEDGRTHRLVLGFTPYGFALPTSLADAMGLPEGTSVEEARQQAQADSVVWITHGDFAFEGAYPGAAPLVELPGVDMVINGHMHGTKKPVLLGQTVWYNPGNIVRLSVDMADEVPSAWAWSPFDEERDAAVSGVRVPRLEQIVLKHTPGAQTFSFEGKHAPMALLTDDGTPMGDALAPLAFTEGMKGVKADLRTGDGSQMREDLAEVMVSLNTPDPARRILDDLAARAARALQIEANQS